MIVLLQSYQGVSDAEAVELTVVDLRWQMVLDRLGATAAEVRKYGAEVRCQSFDGIPGGNTGSSTDGLKLAARASAVVPGRGWSWLWPCLLRRRRDRCDAECRRRAETPFWASVRWPAGWASVVVRTGIRLQPVVQSP
jgi:hypothetical protein